MAPAIVQRNREQAGDLLLDMRSIVIVAISLALLVVYIGLSRPTFAVDLHPTWEAAARVAHGNTDLYGPITFTERDGLHHASYIYPPILAILLVPFGLLSFGVASGLFIAVSIVAVVASLRLLGVTDWRCFGVAAIWPPVIGGIALGNITAFLLLGVALGWRFRARRDISSVSLAFLAVVKLFLWPLLVWEARASLRRLVITFGYAVVILLGSWAAIGFAGLRGYWGVLEKIEPYWQSTGYGFSPLLQDAGMPTTATSILLSMLSLASTVSVAALIAKKRLDDRQSLVLLVAVALLFSPVSWLHYAMLLIVPIALTTPRFSWQWLLPMALWATPAEQANGSVWRLVLFALVISATTVSALLGATPEHNDVLVADGAVPGTGSPEGVPQFSLLRP